MTWIVQEAAAISLFSPAGRRWRVASDEGAAGFELLAKAPSSAQRASCPRWGEEGDRRFCITKTLLVSGAGYHG